MGLILFGSSLRVDFVDSLGLGQVASIKSIYGLRAYGTHSPLVRCHGLPLWSVLHCTRMYVISF